MTSPSTERKATKITEDFLAAELDDDEETNAWLVERIAAALEEAVEASYKKAMRFDGCYRLPPLFRAPERNGSSENGQPSPSNSNGEMPEFTMA
jgi:hypothetical protein